MKVFIQWEEKETETELSHRTFREQLLASDVTAAPSHCWPDTLRRVPVCLQHVNCVVMHYTKAKWPFMLYDVHSEGLMVMIMQDMQVDMIQQSGSFGINISLTSYRN